jgi:cathepsin B
MKFLLSTVALAAVATAAPTANEHDVARESLIKEVNSAGASWVAGHNERFVGQPLDSVKVLCGVKPDSKALLKKTASVYEVKNLTVPEAFDSETNWPKCAKVIGDIRDQSMCGCCWAFAGASAASDRLCINTDAQYAVPLSAQETCFCSNPDGCAGGQVSTPWDYFTQNGITTGGQYNNTGPFGAGYCSDFSMPHCHHHGPQRNDPYPDEGSPGCPSQQSAQCPTKCGPSAVAPNNNFQKDRFTNNGSTTQFTSVQAIQEAIMTDGPVECAFTVYADFANYVSGVYHHVSGSVMGGHAVRIVGWGVDSGVDYWKIANSWNPYWGEKGYFRIKRGTDECGVEDSVVANSAGATWSKMN